MGSHHITGVILAGGQSQRMGGQDKAWLSIANQPLIKWVSHHLRPQVTHMVANANRHFENYRPLHLAVIPDIQFIGKGPLAGIWAVLNHLNVDYLLTVPCDVPFFPANLSQQLYTAIQQNKRLAAVACYAGKLEPAFALIHRQLKPIILSYLKHEQLQLQQFLLQQQAAVVNFHRVDDLAFVNVNTPADAQNLEKLWPMIPQISR